VLSGGGYTLNGGFWSGAASTYRVFLPLALKRSVARPSLVNQVHAPNLAKPGQA
jgi:hypothetical protein